MDPILKGLDAIFQSIQERRASSLFSLPYGFIENKRGMEIACFRLRLAPGLGRGYWERAATDC